MMVRVIYKQEADGRRRLTISGHAGSGPVGSDLYCAAVTALINTLVSFLQYKHIDADVRMDYGFADVSAAGADDAFEVIAAGYRMLSEMGPDYVAFE